MNNGLQKFRMRYRADGLKASGYRMQSDGTLEMFIFEEIDDFFGIGAMDVARVLRENKDVAKILVHLNSPGGMVTEGAAIYNQLRLHNAEVIMQVEGLAASAASVIAMAGDQINIFEGAMFMIHEAWSVTRGFAADHRKTAEVLDQMADTMANIYVARTGQKHEEILEKMNAETWFTAQEAVEFGLADTFIEGKAMAASAVDLGRFQFSHLPDEVLSANDMTRMVDSAGKFLGFGYRPSASNNPDSVEFLQTIPATPTEAPAQETDEMKTIAKALGLPEDATEAQIVAALGPQKHTVAELHRLTGESDDEAAIGVIQAWQASHAKLDEFKAEREAEKATAEKKELDELIAKGQEDKKITPATIEYWKAQPLAAVRSFLKVASPVVSTTEVAPPAVGSTPSASADLMRHNGKTYAEMTGPERHGLLKEDAELFKQMSAEYREYISAHPPTSAEG